MTLKVELRENKVFHDEDIISLYHKNNWSSAQKPEILIPALKNSSHLILAYIDDKLVGLGNAISDGHLVVYYPHLLVDPDYQGKGIGAKIMNRFQEIYGDFHQQMLTADDNAIPFYEKNGFEVGKGVTSMWVYKGDDHG